MSHYKCMDCGEVLTIGSPHMHEGTGVGGFARIERIKEPQEKVVRIEIHYENGDVRFAEGSDADKIMDYWQSGETMNYIHGGKYEGPTLILSRAGEATR
ncbi:MAG TPA: hypothetical protein VNL17_14275 [Verrucomicrobiae bacterium]|nr:hypothetical protein [Verrucomicrobiae bacterium]